MNGIMNGIECHRGWETCQVNARRNGFCVDLQAWSGFCKESLLGGRGSWARDGMWTKPALRKGQWYLKDREATSGMILKMEAPGPGLCVGTFLLQVMPLYKTD